MRLSAIIFSSLTVQNGAYNKVEYYLQEIHRFFQGTVYGDFHQVVGNVSSTILFFTAIIALTLIYAGYRVHLLTIKITGFICGFLLGLMLGGLIYSIGGGGSDSSGLLIIFVIALFLGFIGAAFSLFVNFAIVFLGGAFFTGALGSLILGFSDLNLESSAVITFSILGGIAALFLYKLAFVLLTSYTGSSMMISVIFGSGFYDSFRIYRYLKGNYTAPGRIVLIFLLFFLSGVIIQLDMINYLRNRRSLSEVLVGQRAETNEDKKDRESEPGEESDSNQH
ncbi:MAG: hypothetical protein ACLFT4_07885 [Bacteroidales bacterium]